MTCRQNIFKLNFIKIFILLPKAFSALIRFIETNMLKLQMSLCSWSQLMVFFASRNNPVHIVS